jgi:hypothetical protein
MLRPVMVEKPTQVVGAHVLERKQEAAGEAELTLLSC